MLRRHSRLLLAMGLCCALLGAVLNSELACASPMDSSDLGTTAPPPVPRSLRHELDRDEALLRARLRTSADYGGLELLREPRRLLLRIPARVWFAPDSVTLRSPSSAPATGIVELVTQLMRRRKQLSAQVVVYTDAIGDAAANLGVSQQRAQAIVAALQSRALQSDRIVAIGAGEASALDLNATPEGRVRNRRVEIAFDLNPPAALAPPQAP
jgi:outer membrane protein OmpA-like peptidoglycan-associated protein